MTTIAYRNKIIASDSALTIDNLYVNGNFKDKIGKTPSGCLYGFAGSLEMLTYFFYWVENGENITKQIYIPRYIKGDCDIIYVTPTEKIYHLSRGLTFTGERDYAAIGSGAMLALGVMACGFGAIKAVKKACLHDPHSKMPVFYKKL